MTTEPIGTVLLTADQFPRLPADQRHALTAWVAAAGLGADWDHTHTVSADAHYFHLHRYNSPREVGPDGELAGSVLAVPRADCPPWPLEAA